jgi:hypothetical protein
MSDELANKVIKGYDALKNARSTFEQTLDDITFYVLPEYESQNERNKGSETPDRPVSSAPTDAAILLGGHLFSHTVNTGEQWFTLRPPGGSDDEDGDLKAWLDHAQRATLKAIQNSNFNEAFGEMCTLLGTYGTGAFSTDFDSDREELVFRNHPINGNVYLVEDANGRVNGLYRLLRMTAEQAVERFGDGLPERITDCYGDPAKADTRHDFIQHIGVNPDYDPERLDAESMKFRSIYVYRDEEVVVKRSGFRTFPFACPRFQKVRDFAYGYGAGHSALPSIRELNRAEAGFMDAYEMEAWPPVWLPDEEAVESSEVAPRAVNYFDPQLGQPFQLKTNGNSNALFQRIMQLEQRINRQFFVDVFLAVSQRYGGDKTAREVEEIAEEKLSSIGPMVSRLQSECFAPLIERVVDILMEAGVIDPAPESIAGKGFRVVYTSRIDSKLAAIEVGQFLRAAGEVHNLTMLAAETQGRMDKVLKVQESAIDILERRNVRHDLIVSDRERKKMEEAEAQAMAEAKQQEALAQHAGKVDPMKRPEDGSMAAEMAGQPERQA